jgi:hypothetical protein
VSEGSIKLDPPGLEFALADIYSARPELFHDLKMPAPPGGGAADIELRP